MSNKTTHTRKRYLALAAIFLLLALGLLFLPDKDNSKKLEPEKLLISINDNSRFYSSDLLADGMINNDPSIILVDVRPETEFAKGSLPGALNIPFEDILSEQSLNVFKRKAYDKILLSNNEVLADEAWILLSGKLMERTFVLKGGINDWVSTIINPVEPGESAPIELFELYDTRRAASRYFTNNNTAFEYQEIKVQKATPREKIKKSSPAPVLPPPVEEEEEEEGC